MRQRSPALLACIAFLSCYGLVCGQIECSSTADCTGPGGNFDCVRGLCFDMDSVRLNYIESQLSSPSDVQVTFSLYGIRKSSGACEPVSLVAEQYQSQILDKITMFEDGVQASSGESLMAVCPVPGGSFRLNMMVLVDQSDSVQPNIADVRESVKQFTRDMLALEDQFRGGIQINIAGFDGRAGETTFTSTDLYGPYIEAIGVLDSVPPLADVLDIEDYNALLVFTDGSDQAQRQTVQAVQDAIAAATSIDAYFAVTIDGERVGEFEDFLAQAGRNDLISVEDASSLDTAFAEIADILLAGTSNVFALLFCSAGRNSDVVDYHLRFQGQGDAAAHFQGDTVVFNPTPGSQCNAEYAAAWDGCATIQVTEAQRAAGSCTPDAPATALVVREGPAPVADAAACPWTPCTVTPCAEGYECLQGYCVDMESVVARPIANQALAPSNVMVAFTLLGTMQDGTCGPVAFPPERLSEVPGLLSISVRENGVAASGVETFSGLSDLAHETQLRVMLLVDLSLSLTVDAEAIRSSVLSFVQEMFLLPEPLPEVQIASFDGSAGYVSWTGGNFLSDQTALETAVNEASLEAVDASSNLYGAYISAVGAAEPLNPFTTYSAMVVFTDGTDRAGRNTLAEVKTAVRQSNVFAFMSVNMAGETGPEAADFLNATGRDGEFPGDVEVLTQNFRAIAWQLSARARSIYVYLYCSAIRSGEEVDFELSINNRPSFPRDPIAFTYDSSQFDTSNANQQCRAAMADECTGCESLLDLSSTDGRARVAAAQRCPSCANTRGYSGAECRSDVDECSDLTHCDLPTDNCHASAECGNTEGSFTCTCGAGLMGDGVRVCVPQATCAAGSEIDTLGNWDCRDINECSRRTDNCDANAACTNTDPFFTCTCNTGYVGNGVTCDWDECAAGDDDCDDNALCTNTVGSFTCACREGWTGSGVVCQENECLRNTDNCHRDAKCTDTEGSFTCACKDELLGDGVEECEDPPSTPRSGPEGWQWALIGLGALLLLGALAMALSYADCSRPPPPPKALAPVYYTVPTVMSVPEIAPPPTMEMLVPVRSYDVVVPGSAPPGAPPAMTPAPMPAMTPAPMAAMTPAPMAAMTPAPMMPVVAASAPPTGSLAL